MPSQKKQPLVRRGFVIVLSLTMLALYLAFAVPNYRRPMRGTKSTQILQDLRMIDAAVDQYVLEERNRAEGNPVVLPEELAKLQFDSRSPERGFIESTREPQPVVMSSSKSIVLSGTETLDILRRSEVLRSLYNPLPTAAQPQLQLPQTPPVTVAPSSKVITSVFPPHVIQLFWESDVFDINPKARESDALNDILNKRPAPPALDQTQK